MGGYDFKISEGEEAKKFKQMFLKKASYQYNHNEKPNNEFMSLFYSEETSIGLRFDEETGEVWADINW